MFSPHLSRFLTYLFLPMLNQCNHSSFNFLFYFPTTSLHIHVQSCPLQTSIRSPTFYVYFHYVYLFVPFALISSVVYSQLFLLLFLLCVLQTLLFPLCFLHLSYSSFLPLCTSQFLTPPFFVFSPALLLLFLPFVYSSLFLLLLPLCSPHLS